MTSLLMVVLQPLDCWAKSISQMVGAMSDIVTDYGESVLQPIDSLGPNYLVLSYKSV